jgi:uncharacterized protein (DUF58 family)
MDRLRGLGRRLGVGLYRRLAPRLTLAGWLVLGAGAASAALGIDTRATMAYQAFTFCAALLLVAGLSGLLFRPRLSLRRSLPRFATAGAPLPIPVQVENLGRGVLRGLAVREGLRAEAPLPDLPPGGSCSVTLRLTPERRGTLRLEDLAACRSDPLGLVRAIARVPGAGSVTVLPRRYPVPRPALPSGRRYQQGGVALSSSVGESPEFVSLRDYRPGDPPRRIHWKSQARTGKLIVKEYQEEYFVRHALVLDTFAEPGEVFEESVSAAASFACSVLTQESLLDLLFVGSEAYCVTAGRGLGGEERMLEVLAGIGPCPGRSFEVLAKAVQSRRAGLSAALCVLQAWDEPRRALVRGLRGVGLPVAAMVVVPRGGVLPAEDGPVHRLEAGRLAEGLAGVRA